MSRAPRSLVRLAAPLGLLVVTLLAYLPALGGEFLWDDLDWIVRNDALRGWAGLRRIWFEPGAVIQYYPLTYTSWWLDVQLWGLDPAVFHVENVLLHVLGAWLFALVLERLRVPGAWIGALVFALHPVHTESVAWIVERKNVLSGVLFLGATLAWLRFDDSGRRRTWALALSLFALALLAKTATLMLPAGLVAISWWRHRASGSSDALRARVLALLPWFALSALAAVVTIARERSEGAVGVEWGLEPLQRLALAGRALWFYLHSLLWPANLAFVYPGWSLDVTTLSTWLPSISVVVVAAVLWTRRRRPGSAALLMTGVWFAANLFPVLGFFDLYFMRYAYVADHFQYLASLGPIALVAAMLVRLAQRLQPAHPDQALAAIVGPIALVLGVLTWHQAGTYRDMETLWRATLRRSPDAWLAHTNLGNLLFERGEEEESIEHHRRALAIHPGAVESNNAMGNYLARQGRFDQAETCFRAALEVRGDHVLTWSNRGAMEILRRDYAAAIQCFRRGLQVEPDRVELLVNLASTLGFCPDPALRRPGEALELAGRACSQPDGRTATNLHVLSKAYAAAGRGQDSLRIAREALSLARSSGDGALAAQIEQLIGALERAGGG